MTQTTIQWPTKVESRNLLTKIGWVAGIIEGEGCIVVSKRNRECGGNFVRLAVEMCDLDILINLRDCMSRHATIRERKPPSVNPKHRSRYILTLTGSELASWLMTIYPLMGERRKAKIREALDVWKQMGKPWHFKKLRQTNLRIA